MELLKNTSMLLIGLIYALIILTITLLPTITTIILFYYVIQLEKETCECIIDWRHNFLKYMLFSNIILTILNMVLLDKNMIGSEIHKILYIITVIIGVINTYSYFTYVSDLNETKCNCLKNMPKINNFLNVMKWVFVGISSICVITIPLYEVKNKSK